MYSLGLEKQTMQVVSPPTVDSAAHGGGSGGLKLTSVSVSPSRIAPSSVLHEDSISLHLASLVASSSLVAVFLFFFFLLLLLLPLALSL